MDAQVKWNFGGQASIIKLVFTVNDYVQLRDRALSGDVVTKLPPFLAAAAIRNGKLVPLIPGWPFPKSPIHLIYRQHRHPSSIVRAYLSFCRSYLPTIRKRCET